MPDLLAAGKSAARRRSRRTLALSISAVLLVAGAVTAVGNVLTDGRADPVDGVASPVLTLPERDGPWPMALVRGVVSLRGGCLYVGDQAVVWPNGSTWDPAEQAVRYGSLVIPVGDYVRGGGGFYTVGTDSGGDFGDAWPAAEQCARRSAGGGVVVLLPEQVTPADPAMVATPARARPGDVVSLTFPTEQPRGVGFTLTARSDGTRYELTSNATQQDREPTGWTAGRMGWIDIGIMGPGPDEVLIPPPSAPGEYDLCTGNAVDELCVRLTVSAPLSTIGPTLAPSRPCPAIHFEDRRYVLTLRPEGAGPGVGRVLGTGRLIGCDTAVVTVYSVNEQPKGAAITVSDGESVWLYTVSD
ncbi:hypothetical protein [Nocardioides szechwanensis]|nr:hypothetical protein [Nocardioides szechwanensis]